MVTTERQARLCQELSATADKIKWLEALQEVMRAFGYAYVTLIRLPGGQNSFSLPTIIESSLPIAVVNAMTQNGALGDCLVIKRGASSMMPQYWSLEDPALASPSLLEASDALKAMGMTSGVMLPVHDMSGTRHLMNFAGDRDVLPQACLNELSMIALHALQVYDGLCQGGAKGRSPLTKRELDVVRWTAQGKTSVEIADLFSISEHTVNAYMNNAIRKLDCVNRAQLVAKAIRLRLIN
ncbi:LuxR C-terminal-related transcriptional regulator [Agrobacterium tumefaciens]|uniref:helix-turn-helix transcriptional regulator n=1 Tax=Agrobacterium TaxID=357 RepID=UPI0011A3854C|nr:MULTISPECIES: LuxR C-terminal-related transcriptional regulator [Agrobacterium]QTK80820.1 Autoinducer binding domain-containing protein AtxR [Agrobacterium tumefaciens]